MDGKEELARQGKKRGKVGNPHFFQEDVELFFVGGPVHRKREKTFFKEAAFLKRTWVGPISMAKEKKEHFSRSYGKGGGRESVS